MPARRQSGVDAEGSATPGGKPYKEKETFGCPYPGCGQSYSRMEYLKRHQRKHQDVRPFQCKDCSKSFARSDVLLRHRRRCHPTPPPPDRSSHSPPAMHRGYPGVPISSSRNDMRAASPSYREGGTSTAGRKHSRAAASDHDGQQAPASTRRKLSSEEEDDDDQAFVDSNSRFGRENGMGNGGVYNASNYYGAGAGPNESSTYTPHLLPMFQQGSHGSHDTNHLEDASVLLSMAYGSGQDAGSSGSGHTATVHGQEVVPDGWGQAPTIQMMMDAAGANGADSDHLDTGRHDSIGSSGADIITPTLGDSVGNFLGAMNWLGSSKDESNTSEGANNTTTTTTTINSPWLGFLTGYGNSPKPQSPYPLSSLFSPSVFGMPPFFNPPNPNNHDGTENETNQAVMTILDQLAMYEVPQTRTNPNPERPLLRVENDGRLNRAGPEVSPTSRFYVPAERFASCYHVPHWSMPSLKTLSLMANRTFDTVLNHFSFIHMPTFRIMDTAACLAFAICTVGGVRPGHQEYDMSQDSQVSRIKPVESRKKGERMDGPVPAGTDWESMYQSNFSTDTEEAKNAKEWTAGHVVRSEKTNMLVKSFSLAKGVLMTEYNVALLQALILYHAPFFLSEVESERAMANMFMGTIVTIARQIGFFSQDMEHYETTVNLPAEPFTPNDIDMCWRKWIQLETRRRTAFLVYHLDIVSALESNIPCILTGCEVGGMPLPAPDSIWKAESAMAWYTAMKRFRPMSLDEAMRRIFFLPTYGAFDTLHENADTKFYCLLNESEYGPFARVAMVITLLRGIIDIGEGKRDRGDWRDLTDLWISCSWLKPGKKMLDSAGNDLGRVTQESLRQRFTLGLERWREGWDFDSQCPNPSTSGTSPGSSSGSPNSPNSDAGRSGVLNYCEEALPYYWLAQALLNILNGAPPHEPGWNVFGSGSGRDASGVNYGEMLKSARLFTCMGEGAGPRSNHKPVCNCGKNDTGSSTGCASGPPTVSSTSGLSSVTNGNGTSSAGVTPSSGMTLEMMDQYMGYVGPDIAAS